MVVGHEEGRAVDGVDVVWGADQWVVDGAQVRCGGATDRVVEELDARAGGGDGARGGGGEVGRVWEVVDGKDVDGGGVRGWGVDVDTMGNEGARKVREGEARGGECLFW